MFDPAIFDPAIFDVSGEEEPPAPTPGGGKRVYQGPSGHAASTPTFDIEADDEDVVTAWTVTRLFH